MIRLLTIFFCLAVAPLTLHAGIDTFDFSSEEKEKQYKVLVEELRCPKCKNSNLAGTNSMISLDLKREIHEMVEAGDSNEKIADFMVSRYGDFVLYRPRLRKENFLLWGAPIGMLILGLAVVAGIVRRRSRAAGSKDTLSSEEQAKLAAVLTQGASVAPNSLPSKNK